MAAISPASTGLPRARLDGAPVHEAPAISSPHGLLRRVFDALEIDALSPSLQADVPGFDTWQDALEGACAAREVRLRPVFLSIREALGAATPGASLVAHRSAFEGDGWLALLEHQGGQGRVATSQAKDRWVSCEKLAALLGLDSPDAVLPWMVVEPRSPAAAASPPAVGGHSARLSPFRRLVGLVQPDRNELASVVLYAALVGAFSLATPIAVQQLVNTVAFGGLLQPVVVLAFLLFLGLAFSAFLSGLQAYVVELIQRRIFVRVVVDVAQRLPRVSLRAFDRQYGPELVNRIFDLVTVQKVGSALLLDGTAVLLQTLLGLVVLSFYHPLMLGFSVMVVLVIVVVIFVMGRGAVGSAVAESKAKYAVADWLEELARHSAAFRSQDGRRYALARADHLASGYIETRRRHYRIVLRQLAGALGLRVLASAGLLALGGGLVVAGQLTLGQLVASELILAAIVAGFARVGKQLESFYDILAASDKLGVLLDLPLERDSGASPKMGSGPASVELRGVAFSHPGRSVFRDLSLRIEPGERVALLGAAGCGKSTILDLVSGLREPNEGFVAVDGQDVRELRLEELREQVVLVRHPEVFSGSIVDNVRLGQPGVSQADVVDALEQLGLLDEIRALPEGLETRLSTHGSPLSRGQIARLMLARAIAARPRVLLLDQALAGLDAASRRRVADAVFRDDAPWTVVVASEWDDVVERCDRRVSLGEGE